MIAGTADITNRKRRVKPWRVSLYIFIALILLVSIVPNTGAIFASFRPFAETVRDGFFSRPHSLTLDN